jgi:hypothetical protein
LKQFDEIAINLSWNSIRSSTTALEPLVVVAAAAVVLVVVTAADNMDDDAAAAVTEGVVAFVVSVISLAPTVLIYDVQPAFSAAKASTLFNKRYILERSDFLDG